MNETDGEDQDSILTTERENVLGDFNVNYNFMFGNYVFHI